MFKTRRQLKRENDDLRQRLAAANVTIEDLINKNDAIFAEAAQHNTAHEDERRKLCDRVQELNGELKVAKATADAFRKAAEKKQKEVNDLKKEVKELTELSEAQAKKLSRKHCNTTAKKWRKPETETCKK